VRNDCETAVFETQVTANRLVVRSYNQHKGILQIVRFGRFLRRPVHGNQPDRVQAAQNGEFAAKFQSAQKAERVEPNVVHELAVRHGKHAPHPRKRNVIVFLVRRQVGLVLGDPAPNVEQPRVALAQHQLVHEQTDQKDGAVQAQRFADNNAVVGSHQIIVAAACVIDSSVFQRAQWHYLFVLQQHRGGGLMRVFFGAQSIQTGPRFSPS